MDHRREAQHRAQLAEDNLRFVAAYSADESKDDGSNEPYTLREPAVEGLADLSNDKPSPCMKGYDDADRA